MHSSYLNLNMNVLCINYKLRVILQSTSDLLSFSDPYPYSPQARYLARNLSNYYKW